MVRNLLRFFLGWAAEVRRVERQRRWQRLMLYVAAFKRCQTKRRLRRCFRAWHHRTDETLVHWLLRLPLEDGGPHGQRC